MSEYLFVETRLLCCQSVYFAVVVLGALFSIISSIESASTLVSIAYVYILPKTIDHHMTPGTAFVIMAALGLVPIPFMRY